MSMDMEAGYGDPGATASRAIELGVVGGNLEDQMRPLEEAVSAVEAVLAAGRSAGIDFVLNARTDVCLRAAPCRPRAAGGRSDPPWACLPRRRRPPRFVPGLTDREEIERVVGALGRQRLSLLSIPGRSLPARELQRLGVARVSSGPHMHRAALAALRDAASGLLAGGTE